MRGGRPRRAGVSANRVLATVPRIDPSMRIGTDETERPAIEVEREGGEKRDRVSSQAPGIQDSEPAGYTALRCLVAVAAHFGISTSCDKLVLEHGLSDREPTPAQLVSIAQKLGLRARTERLPFERLVALDRAYPVIARLDNGNSVVVAGINQTPEGIRVAVFDPLASQTGVFPLESDRFLERWAGEVIFVQRDYRLSDPHQPFGLRWFIPSSYGRGRRFAMWRWAPWRSTSSRWPSPFSFSS